MKILILTNIPTPYRSPLYDILQKMIGFNLKLLYMSKSEPNRNWKITTLNHNHSFLKGFTLKNPMRNNYIHIRYGTIKYIIKFNPDIVITSGFNPPMLLAWLYSLILNKHHITMTDAWIGSESHLSLFHRIIRRIVFKTSKCFIGASNKSIELYQSYGISKRIFQSCLCINNEPFFTQYKPISSRKYDLVFSGRITKHKLPFFFTEVVEILSKKVDKISVLVIGDGNQINEMKERLSKITNIDVKFTGYLQQDELPRHYSQGKIFCFPTYRDAWGIVANEACASGMAVMTCKTAGCAGELVINKYNGFILPLDPNIWAERAEFLLSNSEILERMSENSINAVKNFTFEKASKGVLDACNEALGKQVLY